MSDIIENILDLIHEMAFDRRNAEAKITFQGLEILKHLIKLLKWEDSYNHNKHIGDINGWLFSIQRITYKPKNKRFKSEQYYQFLFEEQVKSLDDINTYIKIDLKDYSNLKVKNSNEYVYTELCSLYKKISVDISDGLFIGIDKYGTNYQTTRAV
ncbi:hypothetical protein [Thiospirillum jenense]|uniref:Uncharacterized protein n=1 Tax=Thiospirillum jenense TaxID=1653858 RepID=A0A839HH95_9GAMM|nr:hypothetical protein [Thiospirillum jenense]MBB1125602.1 hypothetical protein [Thiospirillum jenense]